MSIPATQMRPGMIIKFKDDLHLVFSVEHRTPGNLRAFIQAKLRNVHTGAMFVERFRSPDPIDELQLMRYLDGRLEGAKKQETEELLRTNTAARRRLDALREEEKLLRESLETLSEPSKRLSDKVIATLHNEERFRVQAIRNKRLRRNLVWGMAVAASFVLCVLLMRPRESMGNAVAGTELARPALLELIDSRPAQAVPASRT